MYKFFIRRPVTTWMFVLSFIILGFYAYNKIPVDRYPDVEFPIVSISTVYEGASPSIVDTNITKKIEDQLATISGIESIISQSYTGVSRITVIFSLDKDINVGVQEITDAVNRITRFFPEGTENPVIRKIDTSLAPIMAILLHGDAPYGIKAFYADKIIKREFERLLGVGDVSLGGYRDYVLWVRIDPVKLANFKLTPLDISNALKRNNIETPSGRIDSKNREYVIKVYGKPKTPEEVGEIIVKNNIKIKDVADVSFTYDEERSVVRFNGKEALAFIIYKQSKSNTVQVANRVKEKMEELNKKLPEGMKLDINYDSSEFIKRSSHDAISEVILGTILTAFTVFLFLGRIVMTLIPMLAIPVSILGTIFALYLIGQSLNTISLIAIAVAVGLVIDDAIVVMESIYRRNEEGLKGIEAAIKGTRIVIFALLASTSSLIVIFLPILFLEGVIGQFFFSFAVTLIIAIAISYVVSLSFTPMISARLVKAHKKNIFQRIYDKFESLFDVALKWCLNHKTVVIIFAVITVAIGINLAKSVKKEFFPLVDEGRFLIRFETPTGSSFDFTNKKAMEIEKVLLSDPYILRYGMALGEGVVGRPEVNGGMFFVTLVPKSKRPHQKFVMKELREKLAKIKDVKAIIDMPSAVGARAGRNADIQYAIKGSDLEKLSQLAFELEERLKNTEGFVDVDTNLRINKPEVEIKIDKQRALNLGISTQDISNTINMVYGKYVVGTFEKGSESYDMVIKAKKEFLRSYESLNKIYIRAANGELIPLADLIQFKLKPTLNVINRFNRQYSFTLYANLSGIPLGEGTKKVEEVLKQMLPVGYTYEIAGQAKEFKRTFSGLAVALAIAIIGVYMILASIFESLLHPFTVLLTLPFAILGVFGFILITNTSLNVGSYFGIILLIGLVARDSVLFIERIIQLKSEGQPIREAILNARKERLRPILMTTLTIMAALFPVALGLTEGSEQRQPLAIAVIGGLFTALPLSLFIIPVVYEIVESIRNFGKKLKLKKE